jgi:hypothetical protein
MNGDSSTTIQNEGDDPNRPTDSVIFEHDKEDESPNDENLVDDDDDDDLDSSDDEYVDVNKEEDMNGPLPDPPLFSLKPPKPGTKGIGTIIDISRENWDEGTDTKQKAYQRLRGDKNRMFEENKIWKKFTSTFKGLKRCHSRAKKPNKITEYEVPRDPTKFNKKIDDFDPSMLFELEYSKDD